MGSAVAPKRWAFLVSAAFLTVVSLGIVADGFATSSTAAPAKLVGTWKRTVTKKDADVPGNDVTAPLGCKLIITKGGLFTIDCPPWGKYTATITSAKSDRVHLRFNIFGVLRMTYAWRVASNHLTLTKVEDTHGNTEVILPGVWKKA